MSCVKVGMHATAGLLHPPPLWRRSSLGWRGSSLKVFNGARLPAAADRGGKGVRTMAFAIVRGSSRRIQNVLDVRFAKIENVPECSGPARASMSSQLGPWGPGSPPPKRLVTIHLRSAATLHHLRLTALRAAVVPSLRTLRSSHSDLVGLSRKPGIAPIGGLGPVLHL
jgi:hypothetical protein